MAMCVPIPMSYCSKCISVLENLTVIVSQIHKLNICLSTESSLQMFKYQYPEWVSPGLAVRPSSPGIILCKLWPRAGASSCSENWVFFQGYLRHIYKSIFFFWLEIDYEKQLNQLLPRSLERVTDTLKGDHSLLEQLLNYFEPFLKLNYTFKCRTFVIIQNNHAAGFQSSFLVTNLSGIKQLRSTVFQADSGEPAVVWVLETSGTWPLAVQCDHTSVGFLGVRAMSLHSKSLSPWVSLFISLLRFHFLPMSLNTRGRTDGGICPKALRTLHRGHGSPCNVHSQCYLPQLYN